MKRYRELNSLTNNGYVCLRVRACMYSASSLIATSKEIAEGEAVKNKQ